LNLTGLSSTVCDVIQNEIVQVLEGPNTPDQDLTRNTWIDNNRYVATFGNTLASKVGDWVKVIVSSRPQPTSPTVSNNNNSY